MKSSYKWRLAGSALALGLVLLGVTFSAKQEKQGVAELDVTADIAPVADPVLLQWRSGNAQLYDFLVDSSFRMITHTSSTAQTMQVHLKGLMQLRTLQVSAQGVLLGLKLDSVALTVGSESNAESNRLLALPFRVRYSLQGMPQAFEFPAPLSAELRAVLENLIRMFQLELDPGARWSSHETNASGEYQADYQRTTPAQIEKSKLRYLPTAAQPADVIPAVSSEELIQLDPRFDWISAMTIDETLISNAQDGVSITISNHATLKLRPGITSHLSARAEIWDFIAESPQSRTAGLSYEQARKQLYAGLSALDSAEAERSLWIQRLRDLILLDPKLPHDLLMAIKTHTISDRTRAEIYLVLELAASPQAQAALNSVIGNNGWTQLDNLRAIVALSGVSSPTAESLQQLWGLAFSGDTEGDRGQLTSTATLALGTLGKGLQTSDSPDYLSLRSDLVNGALTATDPQQRASFVHAIGNTADTSVAGEILPLLDDPSASVRKAAAQTIGRLDHSRYAEPLLEKLEQEKSSVVRAAISAALVAWDAPTEQSQAAIRHAIQSEADENTRYHMAQLLGKKMEAFPQNRTLLQQLLKTEKSKRIRQQIAEMLLQKP